MKRTEIKRGTRPMRKVSPKQSAKNAARKVQLAGRVGSRCEAAWMGAPGACWGPLTTHEPWTRARGGPIDDPRNQIPVCAEHNRMISQDAEVMRWAKEHGFLVSAAQGPAWLEAGGVQVHPW